MTKNTRRIVIELRAGDQVGGPGMSGKILPCKIYIL